MGLLFKFKSKKVTKVFKLPLSVIYIFYLSNILRHHCFGLKIFHMRKLGTNENFSFLCDYQLCYRKEEEEKENIHKQTPKSFRLISLIKAIF